MKIYKNIKITFKARTCSKTYVPISADQHLAPPPDRLLSLGDRFIWNGDGKKLKKRPKTKQTAKDDSGTHCVRRQFVGESGMCSADSAVDSCESKRRRYISAQICTLWQRPLWLDDCLERIGEKKARNWRVQDSVQVPKRGSRTHCA